MKLHSSLLIKSFILATILLCSPATAQTGTPTTCDQSDIDKDNDGLIEICDLERLNAIRYQLDGTGYKKSAGATTSTLGCPVGGCNGYELIKDLDFKDKDDYPGNNFRKANKDRWTKDGEWQPIGSINIRQSRNAVLKGFSGVFDGNGYTISNLFINMENIKNKDAGGWGLSGVGLFGFTTNTAVVRNIGLLDISILKGEAPRARPDDTSNPPRYYLKGVGGLVGINGGKVINSYVTGIVHGGTYKAGLKEKNREGRRKVGGLVGTNLNKIINSYSYANVTGRSIVGGLVGENCYKSQVGCLNSAAEIINSYARGIVSSESEAGGLVGANRYKITNSYARPDFARITRDGIEDPNFGGLVAINANTEDVLPLISRPPIITASYWQNDSLLFSDIGEAGSEEAMLSYSAGRSASDLKSPIDASWIYETWNANDWDFGTPDQYPILNYTSDKNPETCSEKPRRKDIDPPQCGSLLPNQGTGLRDLNIPNAILEPNFSSDRTEYTVLVDDDVQNLSLRLKTYNPEAEIKLKGGIVGTVIGSTETTISLPGDTTDLKIIIRAPGISNITYTLTFNKRPLAITEEIKLGPRGNIEINADGTVEVDEGSEIILSVDAGGDYYYKWTQSPTPEDSSHLSQSTPTLSVTVPPDFIKDNSASTRAVTFTVAIRESSSESSDPIILSKTLIVRKIDNDENVLTPQVTMDDSSLTVNLGTIADEDGVGQLNYRWEQLNYADGDSQWRVISSTTNNVYMEPPNTPGSVRYRVQVSYTDTLGYATNSPILGPFRLDVDDDDDGLIEIYYLDDLDAVRHQLDGSGYNTGNGSDTKITNGCSVDGCNGYELARDLDFATTQSYINVANKEKWTTGVGWLPIGDKGDFFQNTFEGNGHTISMLIINRPGMDYVGLFGYAGNRSSNKKATIVNLGLLNIKVKGNDRVGGLVGEVEGVIGNDRTTIANSYATGYVEGNDQVGGLIGQGNRTNIANSYATGSVMGNNEVGGLIGQGRFTNIANSHATGSVEGIGEEQQKIGGLIGYNELSNINNSYASGDVRGKRQVGGLVGHFLGTADSGQTRKEITNSYASGCVTGEAVIGGLVGLTEQGSITNSYTTGCVSENGQTIGGLAGSRPPDDRRTITSINSSYWAKDPESRLPDLGDSIVPYTAGLSADELKSPTTATGIYSSWSTDDWDFGTKTIYPALRYAGLGETCDTDPETALPQCGDLLPNQRNGLSALFLLANGNEILNSDLRFYDKPFSPLIFEYNYSLPLATTSTISELQVIPFAFNDNNATIVITDEVNSSYFDGKSSGQASDPIDLNDNAETILTIAVTDYGITTRYTLVLHDSAFTISKRFKIEPMNEDGTVNEGDTVTIEPLVISNTPPSYSWTHSLDDPSVISGQTNPVLSFNIPEDFVGTDDTRDVTFKLTVTNDDGLTTSRSTVLMVKRVDNGPHDIRIEISATTITVSVISDPDGDGDGDFTYQWQQRILDSPGWTNISTAADTPNIFSVPLNTPGSTRYRVLITHTDAQNHTVTIQAGPFRSDIDQDDDGLIEIHYLEDLDAIRYKLNGESYKSSSEATENNLGCAEEVCKGYELDRNLDFNEPEHYLYSENMNKWQTDAGWQPISGLFNAAFEGNDLTISNLFINLPSATSFRVALFKNLTENAEIKNLGLLDVNIQGFSLVGGLAATNAGLIINSYVHGSMTGDSQIGGLVSTNEGRIINSHTNISVAGTGNTEASLIPGGRYVGGIGGLVGLNQETINGSYAIGDVTGENITDVGGLVGNNEAFISNSFATGNVSGNLSIGGLVGLSISTGDTPRIANSFATGNVRGTGTNSQNLGGLIGKTEASNIRNTYANGTVLGDSNIGGLIGMGKGDLILSHNYTTSLVTGNSNIGGLIGSTTKTVNILASYWQEDGNGNIPNVAQGEVNYITHSNTHSDTPRRRATELKSPTTATGIYLGWSTADWNFGTENEYPILRYGEGFLSNPACDTDSNTELPDCGPTLGGQQPSLISLILEESDNSNDPVIYRKVALSQPFESDILNYTAEFDIGTTLIRLSPTANSSSSTISYQIDAAKFQELTNSASFEHTLQEEDNNVTIKIRVASPPRSSMRGTQEYSIELSRSEGKSFLVRTKVFLEGPLR